MKNNTLKNKNKSVKKASNFRLINNKKTNQKNLYKKKKIV